MPDLSSMRKATSTRFNHLEIFRWFLFCLLVGKKETDYLICIIYNFIIMVVVL